MSKRQYVLICALSALCLVLAIEEQRLAEEGRIWQDQAAPLQAAIDGSLRNRLGSQKIDAVLQDLVNASANNFQIRQWLTEQRIIVKYAPTSQASPPASGATQTEP